MSQSDLSSSGAPAPLLLLARVHWLQTWRRIKDVRGQSPLLSGVVFLFLSGYFVVAYWLFVRALKFLGAFPGLGTILTERMLYLLFAFLFAMLLLSNLIITYTNFFKNRESVFLLSLPVPFRTIFQWKFLESVVLASWGFLFLIAPLLAAFGQNRSVPWHFYMVTILVTALFIMLPGVAGAWVAIQVARYLDRRSFQAGVIVGALALLVIAGWWKTQPAEEVVETRVLDMLDQLLNKTRFAQFPFLPSYWLSSSILQWAEGVLSAAGFFILVLLSHVSFFGYLAFTRLGDSFYETASAVQSRASLLGEWGWFRSVADRRQRMAHRPSLMERLFGVIPWLAPDAKALVVKDIRTFWRDTTQWGQSVVLFGLLGVYVLNLRHFTHTLANPFWVTLVAYLNLGACSLNLATVTTRFVYPQFSLEGRRLWIVGMAPMGLARVVKTKYWMATICSLSVTMLLVTLSSYMLKMSWGRIGYFAVVTCVMTFSLNGLAVGLGMLYPNFKDGNPSKIVSGLGGTLCLILSFLYILVSVLALGFGTGGVHPRPEWVVSSIFVFAALSFLVGWMPLKLGFRQLNRIEI